jgi:fermentation-respiration switch protein FrsA (DUF1100 family)
MLRVLALLAILAVLLLLVWLGQRSLIYFPMGVVPLPAAAGLPGAEAIAFATDDGLTLGGWFVPGAGQTASPKRRVASAAKAGQPVTVIVFNGNAGNRAFRAPLAAALAERGISVLLFDYRGYGGNPGSPSEEGLAADARAARRYVAGRAGSDRIVYFGESLGSGVAVRLAAEQPPAALILRSPFTSLTDTGRHHYPFLPVGMMLIDRFASIDRIRDIRCPLLVIAADHDSVVPTGLSRRLFEAALEPKRLAIIDRTDHNDYELLAGQRVVTTVLEFLEQV